MAARTAADVAADPQGWRQKFKQARFRTAIFFVDQDSRAGGRRVALHEYPKRNVGYAEDMGQTSPRFTVQGYLIGHEAWGQVPGMPPEAAGQVNYLDLKDALIDALEQDGPGWLRLPLPYRSSDVLVMVQQYAITESREKGGMCTVEMGFVEYGDPSFRATMSTAGNITQAASALEGTMLSVATGLPLASVFASDAFANAAPYYGVYTGASGAQSVASQNQPQ